MTIRVNREEVPEAAIRYELDRLVKFYSEHMSAEQIKKQMPALRKKAKEQAIGAKLMIQEAKRLDIGVSQEDIETRYQSLVRNAGGEDAFHVLLEKQNLTEEAVRASIEEGRRVDILVERITAGISDPTEEEMQEHFKQHAQEYVKSARAQVQHILIEPDSDNAADKETAMSKLLEIKRRIEDGANFADEAAAHSDCQSGVKTGGSLGWIAKGMAVPALDKVIFSLKPGQLSDVVESHLGLHILKTTAHEPGGEASYAEVADNIRDFLRHTRRGIAIADYVQELKNKASIEEY